MSREPGAPVVIGGSGGSGTRVVKQILDAGGYFLGARLNETQHDALDIATFDVRWGPRWFEHGATEDMRRAFEAALEAHLAPMPASARGWGWKHPMSSLLLPFLDGRFPGLRFVHLVRDGRDMALSPNQLQLRLYGPRLLDPSLAEAPAPERALAFWARTNLRTADFGEGRLGARYLRIRFEDLCAQPAAVARTILAFAGADTGEEAVRAAAAVVRPPESLGRWRRAPEAPAPTGEGAAALRRFGYAVDGAATAVAGGS